MYSANDELFIFYFKIGLLMSDIKLRFILTYNFVKKSNLHSTCLIRVSHAQCPHLQGLRKAHISKFAATASRWQRVRFD